MHGLCMKYSEFGIKTPNHVIVLVSTQEKGRQRTMTLSNLSYDVKVCARIPTRHET